MTRAADLAKLIAGGGSITVSDNSENLKLITTDADASVGPTLRMDRQSASAADSDLLGKINFVGHNDAGTPEDIGYAGITAIISDASDGTEDGKLAINTMVAGTERSRIFVDAGDLNNNEVYNANIRLNYNLTDKMQISSKVIFSDIQHAKSFDSYESSGVNLSISRIFPFGTFTASATHLTNVFDTRKITVSSLKDREDTSLVTNLILKGDINQLLPFLKKINKDNSIYYTISFRESNVNSTISSYEIKRSFKKIGISKRINFND